MKLTRSLLLCLVFACVHTSPANAVLSGSYRCLGLRADTSPRFLLEIKHHNPNTTAQKIKRIRLFDGTGTLYHDTDDHGDFTIVVPPRGTQTISLTSLPPPQGIDVTVIVNWSQGADVAPPIIRNFHLIENSAGELSLSYSGCP